MLRAVYVDLDGTLLGPGGSLFTTPDGGFALEATRALQACHRAGVEVVIYSGRRHQNVFDVARLIGQRSFIFELGCGLVLDGELEWLTDGVEPSSELGTIWEQIRASGAPDLLSSAFISRLEEHTPWSTGREVSHLYRGEVDLDQVRGVLDEAGLGWLRLVDNGVISAHGSSHGPPSESVLGSTLEPAARGVGDTLAVKRLHVYHLIPAASSKSRAVARHMQNRGYAPEECIAIGDSREDMEAASVVGTFWLVANALARDPTLRAEIDARSSVRVTEESYGAGVYEAVVTTLAGA